MEVKLLSCFVKHVLSMYGDMEIKFHAFIILRWIEMNGLASHTTFSSMYGDMEIKFHAFIILRWIEMNGLASHTTFSQRKHFWLPLDETFDWYLKLVWRMMRSFALHEIKSRFISHSVRSLVTLLNELYHHLLAL